jgi:hypothetical protein
MEMNEYLCMFINSTRTIPYNRNDQTIPARILLTDILIPYFPSSRAAHKGEQATPTNIGGPLKKVYIIL